MIINIKYQEVILKNQHVKNLITSIPRYQSTILLPLRDVLTKSDITYQYFNEDVKIKNIIIKEIQNYKITSNTDVIFFNKNITKFNKVIEEFNKDVEVSNTNVNTPQFQTKLSRALVDYNKKEINKGKSIVSDAVSKVNVGKTIVSNMNYKPIGYKSDVITPDFNIEKYKSPLELMSKEVSVSKNINFETEYQDIADATTLEEPGNFNIVKDLKDSNVSYGPFPYLYTSAFSVLYGQILQRIPGITGLPGGGKIVNLLKDLRLLIGTVLKV